MTTAFVPLDTAAVAAGADAVAAAVADTGAAMVRNGSRGMCWAEPTMEVEHDGARLAFGNVAATDVPGIFQQQERHAKCLGEVSEIDYLHRQTRAVFDRAGTSHPLELPKTTVLEECLERDPGSLIAEIETSGLRGRGGAGFPAHIKWRTVFDTPGEQKYVVCNADEGEYGTFADRILKEG
ncbi:MAG: formate dehydrogenase, partial [Gammaproteobacteria bacterium]|nr:formate dehydrogenase [Gammaproteobacteria bacterium]